MFSFGGGWVIHSENVTQLFLI